MAGKKVDTQTLRDLLTSLNEAGQTDAAEKIGQQLEKSAKLTRSMLKSIDEVRRAQNKMFQEKLKQAKAIAADEELGEKERKNRLKTIKDEIKELQKYAKAQDEVIAANEEQTQSSKKANEEHSKTPKLIQSAMASLSQYTSVVKLFDKAIDGLTALFTRWTGLQEEITSGMGELAQRTGATRNQLQQFRAGAEQMRETMSRLGGSISGWTESFQFVRDSALAMRMDMSGMTEQFQEEILAAQRGLGLSADQTAQLFRTLGTGIANGNEDLGDFILNIREFSESIGANSATMTQDFLDSRDALQRFGEDGQRVFQNTATFANRLGFETRRVLDMARQFDTFGGASEHINQLNAMFGTTISSLEMIQEEDPVRRIEMITGAIREQGIEWNSMNVAQQRSLAQSLGVSESEASRLMNGASMAEIQEEQTRRAQEQEELTRRQGRAQETILGIIEATTTRFETWRTYLERIYNDLSEALSPIFEAINNSANGVSMSIREWIQEIVDNPDFKDTIRSIAEWIRELPTHIREFLPTWETIKNTAIELWPTIRSIGTMIVDVIRFAVEHREAIAIALGVGAAVRLGSALGTAFSAIQSITTAAPGMVSAFSGLAVALAPLAGLAAAAGLANMAENRRVEEGSLVRNRDPNTMGRLQSTAADELRRRSQSGNTRGSDRFTTGLGEGLGLVSGQEADQERNNIESVIDDFIRPGNRNPIGATRELLSILGPQMANDITRNNGASSFEEFVKSRFMRDPHLRDAFWQSLGLPPPGGIEIGAPADVSTETSSSISATESAPVTAATTSQSSSHTSVGGVEIVAADVILDGNRVGQAIFNISRR